MDYSLTTAPPGSKNPADAITVTPPGANDPGVIPGSITPPAILPTDALNATLAALMTQAQSGVSFASSYAQLAASDPTTTPFAMITNENAGDVKQLWKWNPNDNRAEDHPESGISFCRPTGAITGAYNLTAVFA